MGIFNAFVQAEGSKELSLDELDAKTKGDKQLLCIFTYSKAYTEIYPLIMLSSHHASTCCM